MEETRLHRTLKLLWYIQDTYGSCSEKIYCHSWHLWYTVKHRDKRCVSLWWIFVYWRNATKRNGNSGAQRETEPLGKIRREKEIRRARDSLCRICARFSRTCREIKRNVLSAQTTRDFYPYSTKYKVSPYREAFRSLPYTHTMAAETPFASIDEAIKIRIAMIASIKIARGCDCSPRLLRRLVEIWSRGKLTFAKRRKRRGKNGRTGNER